MDDTFDPLRRALICIGVSFFSKTDWNSRIHLLYQTFVYIIGALTMICLSGYMVVNAKNSTLLIEGACIWSTGIVMFISLQVCFIYRYKFHKLLNEMALHDRIFDMPLVEYAVNIHNSDMKCLKIKQLKDMVDDTQKKLLEYTNIALKLFMCSVLLISSLYMCDAFYQFLTRTNDKERPLGFPMWFPWSLDNLCIYMATLIFQTYSGFVSAAAYPAFQCTVMLLIGQVIRQLKILGFILLNLDELAMDLAHTRDERWQLYCTEILTQCAKHYVTIKRFSHRLNAVCQSFYLVLILNAMMLVCVCSVKIAISDKTALDVIKYYIHEAAYVLMVMTHCLLGQEVDNQSVKLEQVVTEKFYIFDRKHKKHVLIFAMALRQKMPIYIFGSITLSLPTFTWFIKTGMSFFTLVMSVLEEQ